MIWIDSAGIFLISSIAPADTRGVAERLFRKTCRRKHEGKNK